MAYALEFLGGFRTGEASALCWGGYEPVVEPLGRIISARPLQLTANVQGGGEPGETEAGTGIDALPRNSKAGIPFRNPGLISGGV